MAEREVTPISLKATQPLHKTASEVENHGARMEGSEIALTENDSSECHERATDNRFAPLSAVDPEIGKNGESLSDDQAVLITANDVFATIERSLNPPVVPPTRAGVEQVLAWAIQNFDTLKLYRQKLKALEGQGIRPLQALKGRQDSFASPKARAVNLRQMIQEVLDVIGQLMAEEEGEQKEVVEDTTYWDSYVELLKGLREHRERVSGSSEDCQASAEVDGAALTMTMSAPKPAGGSGSDSTIRGDFPFNGGFEYCYYEKTDTECLESSEEELDPNTKDDRRKLPSDSEKMASARFRGLPNRPALQATVEYISRLSDWAYHGHQRREKEKKESRKRKRNSDVSL
ncbi:MAG: hypothetical protein Q9188_004688 [Gyalolechia gomerana]